MKNVQALRAKDETLAMMLERLQQEHPLTRNAIVITFEEGGLMDVNYFASDCQMAIAAARLLSLASEEFD